MQKYYLKNLKNFLVLRQGIVTQCKRLQEFQTKLTHIKIEMMKRKDTVGPNNQINKRKAKTDIYEST